MTLQEPTGQESIAQESIAAVTLRGVTKHFGDAVAVAPTDLSIRRNEFFSILGPSGCGKTTLMRMITGFETPTAGIVELDGVDVRDQPTRKRDLNMLFQSYALFPHLSVYDNVAFELRVRYGRRIRRLPEQFGGRDLDSVVTEAISLVRMSDYARRKPDQLSGGQRQRVALARAIVSRPSVVLLDEPLGALDQQLRKQMQIELTRLQRDVGITFVYVTHDQEEALTMSDRIAVMSEGVVQQVGTPREIYEEPVNSFVASFIGTCNLLPVSIIHGDDRHPMAMVDGVGQGRLPVPATVPDAVSGGGWVVAVRPEAVSLSSGHTAQGLPATVNDAVYLGNQWRLYLQLGTHPFIVTTTDLPPGLDQPHAAVTVDWPARRARLVAAQKRGES
ncbi:MAG: ABC transporter ATP-binding protein [Gordonia sp. (in: high G+C Gram-positive bacteria)]